MAELREIYTSKIKRDLEISNLVIAKDIDDEDLKKIKALSSAIDDELSGILFYMELKKTLPEYNAELEKIIKQEVSHYRVLTRILDIVMKQLYSEEKKEEV